MLSQSNINKLIPNGIYTCEEPMLDLIPKYKRSDPYWCMNWVFSWHQGDDNNYYMEDTYWSSGATRITLTDENFDNFKFLFKRDEVEKMPTGTWDEWDSNDRWRIALDSGGWSYPYFFIRKGAKKNKDAVIERLRYEIESLERNLDYKKRDLERVINDEVDLRYV